MVHEIKQSQVQHPTQMAKMTQIDTNRTNLAKQSEITFEACVTERKKESLISFRQKYIPNTMVRGSIMDEIPDSLRDENFSLQKTPEGEMDHTHI